MSGYGSSSVMFLPILLLVLYLAAIGIGIYCTVLFIKLARRGIKALDIYLEEKGNKFGR